MFDQKKTTIKSKVEVGEAHDGSTIIGVKYGPSLDEIRQVFQEEYKNLLLQRPYEITEFGGGDPVAEALFACESKGASTLGFAVNNSGLLICPSIVHPITIARHLTSGKKYDVECVERRNMLQALRVDKITRALIPSYRPQPQFDEKLFVFNDRGERCILSVEAIYLTAKIEAPGQILLIRNGFMTRFAPPQKIIGGPVINEAYEVMGIAVGSTDLGHLVVQPWSKIESCIEMEVETL